jgi:glycosyltransferase involved in cell wall biosynthesis
MAEPALIAQTLATSALKGMRIALVVPSVSAHGGSERHLQILLPALREAGAEVRVYSASAADSVVPGVEVREAALRDSINPLARARQASAVSELVREIAANTDLVEFQRVAPYALARKLSRLLPTVLSVYTAEHTCPSRGRYLRKSQTVCQHAPGLGCLSVDRREGCLAFQDGRPFSWRDKAVALLQMRRNAAQARLFSLVTFNSQSVADLYLRYVGQPRLSRVATPPLESWPHVPAIRDFKRLAFVGRVEAFKGVFDLLPVLEALPDCTLDVIGDGSGLSELRENARARGLAGRINIHGWLGAEKLSVCLAKSSCLLVPSRLFEAWGMVGPEAIAQGCPVVAYDTGGIREWCLPQFGSLVPVGDVRALASAARSWLERLAAGLDTSSWHDEAECRWGVARYVREYSEALCAAVAAFKAAR